MYLKEAINNLLEQIEAVLQHLSDTQYSMPVGLLSNSTVGQHVRHVIELYAELDKGYYNGVVCYDKRKRDHAIETDRQFAIQKLHEISKSLGKPDKELLLAVDFGNGEQEYMQVQTNYFRELIYNVEHTVHHMALMRVGINAVSKLHLPDTFGVAVSTQKFRKLSLVPTGHATAT